MADPKDSGTTPPHLESAGNFHMVPAGDIVIVINSNPNSLQTLAKMNVPQFQKQSEDLQKVDY